VSPDLPTAALTVRVHQERPFFEAMWRQDGVLVKRRIGPAWLARNPSTGKWDLPRRGRVAPGYYDEARAHVAAAALVNAHAAEAAEHERLGRERRERGATFAAVAARYLRWLADVRGAKPSTLRDHGYVLGPNGRVTRAISDRLAAKVTTGEIEDLLAELAAETSARTVNKYRAVISAVYGYGQRSTTFNLAANPVRGADKRREPHRGALNYYSPAEIEALARALAAGLHRAASRPAAGGASSTSGVEPTQRQAQDGQDAELVRVASYAGLRLGELLALRWRDVDFAGHALTIERGMSAGVESSTKSGKVRRVPLADQAAAALDRLSRRQHFTTPEDLVFVNELGRTLDSWALRSRFKRARDAAGLRPLRLHDLRHTYGSLLAAAGVDLVTIQAAMGHSALATTSIYLHARPASEQAQVFTRAFESRPTSLEDVPHPSASVAAVDP
jgi:integrase